VRVGYGLAVSLLRLIEFGIIYPKGKLIWLSPYIQPDLPAPFMMAASINRTSVDKSIVAPPLDYCFGYPAECGEGIDESKYVERGERNLREGRKELRDLEAIQAPPTLAGALSYLIGYLTFNIRTNEAIWEYIRTGRLDAMREAFRSECHCPLGDDDLKSLSDRPGVLGMSARAMEANSMFNRTLACHSHNVGLYPLDSWRAFTKEFGIVDVHTFRQID
jgi:hypothetical protein